MHVILMLTLFTMLRPVSSVITRYSTTCTSSFHPNTSTSSSFNLITPSRTITSPTNPLPKHILKLQSNPKYVKESMETVLEGIKNVSDLWQRSESCIFTSLLVTEKGLGLLNSRLKDSDYSSPSHYPSCETVLINDAVANKISSVNTNQGVFLILKIPPYIEQSHSNDNEFYLILDGVSDPGNVGTLIRSHLAFAPTTTKPKIIMFGSGCANPFGPAVLRSSAGASFLCEHKTIPDLEGLREFFRDVRGKGKIFVASMAEDGAENNFEEADFKNACGLVLGNEGAGVCESLRLAAACSEEELFEQISVEMSGKVESLNVAVVGSIILNKMGKYIPN